MSDILDKIFPPIDYSNVFSVVAEEIGPVRTKRSSTYRWLKPCLAAHGGICQYCNLDCERLRITLDLAFHYRKSRLADRMLHRYKWAFRNGRGLKSRLWEIDHKTPLRSGGRDDMRNIRTLCIPCHRKATIRYAQIMADVRFIWRLCGVI